MPVLSCGYKEGNVDAAASSFLLSFLLSSFDDYAGSLFFIEELLSINNSRFCSNFFGYPFQRAYISFQQKGASRTKNKTRVLGCISVNSLFRNVTDPSFMKAFANWYTCHLYSLPFAKHKICLVLFWVWNLVILLMWLSLQRVVCPPSMFALQSLLQTKEAWEWLLLCIPQALSLPNISFELSSLCPRCFRHFFLPWHLY